MAKASHQEPLFIATVGYVRSLRIGALAAYCGGRRAGGWLCHHDATVSIDEFADELPLRAIKRRLRCDACGTRGEVDVRPNWAEITSRPASPANGWMMPPDG
jgi:hypothetical protein